MYFIVMTIIIILIIAGLVTLINNTYSEGEVIFGCIFLTILFAIVFWGLIPSILTGYTESRKVEVKQYLHNELEDKFIVKLSNTKEIIELGSFSLIMKIKNGQKYLYKNRTYNYYGEYKFSNYTAEPKYKRFNQN